MVAPLTVFALTVLRLITSRSSVLTFLFLFSWLVPYILQDRLLWCAAAVPALAALLPIFLLPTVDSLRRPVSLFWTIAGSTTLLGLLFYWSCKP